MNVLHKKVKYVSGVYFQISGAFDFINEIGTITYLLYLKTGNNIAEIHKLIRMFSIPYRTVLIEVDKMERVGIVLFGDDNEREQLDSIMEWIRIIHPEWVVIKCQEKIDIPRIIGYRIANNLFHEKKLSLQGEILD